MENLIGTSGTNTLTGTAGNNLLNGKAGDDYIDGGAGSDMIIAGAGNDTIVYDGIDKKIDGGTGYDTLLFLGTNQSLNLRTNLAVTNVEQLWLYGGGGHQLWFTAADIIRVSDIDKFIIKGNNTDHITLGDLSGWTLPTAVNPDGSITFTNGAASFTATPGMQIDGYSQAANISISSPALLEVQEDTNVSADGYLILHISVQVTDANPGESVLSFSGDAANLGTLSLISTTPVADGNIYQYDYKLSNTVAQGLSDSDPARIDNFHLVSLDGSTKDFGVTIDTQSTNTAPQVNYGFVSIDIQGVPSTAEILANTITRTGAFIVLDDDLGDTISVVSSSSKITLSTPAPWPLDANHNAWTFNWTLSINDDDLQRMAADASATEIIPFVISDNHGNSTTWNMSFNLSGDLTGTGITGKTIGTTGGDNVIVGANQWYFGDSGLDQIEGTAATSLMVGGNDRDFFTGNGLMYGDEGNDFFLLDSGISIGGKAYGGDGDDTLQLSDTTNFQAFGNSGNDTFTLGSGNINLTLEGGSGADTFRLLTYATTPVWVLDFDISSTAATGDKIRFSESIPNPDISMFSLSLVTPAPGDSSVPAGVTSYYEFKLTPNPNEQVTQTYHLLNIIASDQGTAYTVADIFDNMIFT